MSNEKFEVVIQYRCQSIFCEEKDFHSELKTFSDKGYATIYAPETKKCKKCGSQMEGVKINR